MKEIKLDNFRCYREQTIAFKPGVNLLIGDNASGKTSVLKACKYVLSAFFSGFSDEHTKWISPDVDDFRQVIVDGILSPEQPIHISFNTADIFADLPPSDSYTLVKNSKKNSRSLTSEMKGYKDYSAELMKLYFNERGQQKPLPLFANFSTEDIHSTRKLADKPFRTYQQKPSFGYYECLAGDGFLPYWIKRLLVLEEGQKNLVEIAIVRNAISKALGAEGCNIIADMEVRPIQKKIYYKFIDGREVASDYLSDGYRRLVSIVTDVAFRCALLNRGIYGEEACERTKGTVLIDEVDLHLHPTLQSLALKGLRNAFPQLQFIVSSHAPMVMSGVESNDENVVYKLSFTPEGDYEVAEVDTYGMDLSTISDVILKQVPRTPEVDEKLSELFSAIDDDETESARTILQEMQQRYGTYLPELAEAEAMLNFIIEDDEADSEE